MADDQDKVELLRELGYGGNLEPVDALLKEAGLSRPGKPRIATSKKHLVKRLIDRHFQLVCHRGDCQAAAPSDAHGRQPALASDQRHCEVCGGGANGAAVDRMVAAMRRTGWSRLCVVGGSPNSRRELEDLVAKRVELKLIDGSIARTASQGKTDLDWADRLVLWGGTYLDHKVSRLYRGPKVIQIAKRGIQHLAEEVVASADRESA